MKLLLDIGNTRIKWAYQNGDCLEQPGEFLHRGKTLNDVRAKLQQLPVQPQQAALVNVAGPELEDAIVDTLAARFGVATVRVRSASTWGDVVNGYADPAQLGADRWAAVVGAWQQYRSDVCVVDAGTAVTVDLVRADGQHLGGVILAGRQLARQVLGVGTADIAAFSAAAAGPGERDWFGRSTHEAVERGAIFSLCATIERAAAEFPGRREQQSAAPHVVLTGGDADILGSGLTIGADTRPLLVLEGLAYLASGA